MSERIVKVYATISLNLVVPDDMEDQQAIDQFFENTAYSFEETEDISIDETEFLELTTDSPYGDELEDEEEDDLEDELGKGFKGFII